MGFRGSCHCGKVAFKVDETPIEAIECNCSICRRKGYILAFTAASAFTLETPRDALTQYSFGKHAIRHQFCNTCGCGVFGEAEGPQGPGVAINLRCADDLDLSGVTITPFDGASL